MENTRFVAVVFSGSGDPLAVFSGDDRRPVEAKGRVRMEQEQDQWVLLGAKGLSPFVVVYTRSEHH